MKTIFISDLQKNQVIELVPFAINEVKKNEDKNGNLYFSLVLSDKTGKIDAKIWSDNLKNCDTKIIKAGRLAAFTAKVDEYKGKLQLNILSGSGVDESAIDDFIQRSEFDTDEMLKSIVDRISNIKNQRVKKLLEIIFNDKDFVNKFKNWPAAKTVHHDFRSGMLQHVCEMLSIMDSLKFFYKIDYDILTAGIILHDAGKIYELEGELSTDYSVKGQLFGHIVIGTEIVNKFGGEEILEEEEYIHLVHLILSHHGTKEYGSPVVPSTIEAVALTNIDKLSSKTQTALAETKSIGDNEQFSNYSRWLDNAKFWKVPYNSISKNNNENNTIGHILNNSDNNEDKSNSDNDQIPLV